MIPYGGCLVQRQPGGQALPRPGVTHGSNSVRSDRTNDCEVDEALHIVHCMRVRLNLISKIEFLRYVPLLVSRDVEVSAGRKIVAVLPH